MKVAEKKGKLLSHLVKWTIMLSYITVQVNFFLCSSSSLLFYFFLFLLHFYIITQLYFDFFFFIQSNVRVQWTYRISAAAVSFTTVRRKNRRSTAENFSDFFSISFLTSRTRASFSSVTFCQCSETFWKISSLLASRCSGWMDSSTNVLLLHDVLFVQFDEFLGRPKNCPSKPKRTGLFELERKKGGKYCLFDIEIVCIIICHIVSLSALTSSSFVNLIFP